MYRESYTVTIVGNDRTYECSADESLLAGMHRLDRTCIPVGCRGGGCGVCKIEVLSGRYISKVMSREHVSVTDEAESRVLACRVFPRSNIRLRVIGKMAKGLSKIVA